jgi:hypothetical protein
MRCGRLPAVSILATKLFKPPPRPGAILRTRLIEPLSEGRRPGRTLTLISAPAGFGKFALLSARIDQGARQDPKLLVAWLSLDTGDSEPSQFLRDDPISGHCTSALSSGSAAAESGCAGRDGLLPRRRGRV